LTIADEKRHCRRAHLATTRPTALHGASQPVARLQGRGGWAAAGDFVPATWQRACDHRVGGEKCERP